MFYKYIGNQEDGKVVDYLRRFVENGTIKATMPSEFNDPAELKVIFDFNASDDEIRERFWDMWPGSTKAECESWLQHRWAGHGEAHDALMLRAGLLKRIGVICLTKEEDNYLMWSHYANSHTGFCIGFDDEIISNLTTDEMVCRGGVAYKLVPPTVNFYKSGYDEIIFALLMNKEESWSYEKEFRIAYKEKGIKEFDRSLIKEVVIGCRASAELKRYATQLIGSGIKVYQMKDSIHSYGLVKAEMTAESV